MLHKCSEACQLYLPRYHARHRHHGETMIAQALLVLGLSAVASMRITDDYDRRIVTFSAFCFAVAATILVRAIRDMWRAPVI